MVYVEACLLDIKSIFCICFGMFIIAKVTQRNGPIRVLIKIKIINNSSQFSVHANRFYIRLASAIHSMHFSIELIVYLLLHGPENSFEFERSEWWSISNGVVSISAWRPTLSIAYDDTMSAHILSQCIWHHRTEFGKLCCGKWMGRAKILVQYESYRF